MTNLNLDPSNQNKTVLVTGGAGYIGSWVTRHLLGLGYKVKCFDRLMFGSYSLMGVVGHPNYTFIQGDIRDRKELSAALKGVDYVAHLAAIVGEAACKMDEDLTRSTNLTGTQNVLEECLANNVKRLIFFSTCSSYGVQDTSIMANEETPLNPVSLYAESKIDAEKILLDRVKNESLAVTIFRPSTVHGLSARMRFDLMVNHFVKDAFKTKELSIFGQDMWRPLMWVGEGSRVIALTLAAPIEKVRNQIFNLGQTEANYRKREIGTIIKEKFLPELKLDFTSTDADARSYRVDFSKVKNVLGFELSRSLEDCVGDLVLLMKHSMVKDPESSLYKNA